MTLPWPDEAKLSCPGFDLASATSSLVVYRSTSIRLNDITPIIQISRGAVVIVVKPSLR